MSTPPIPNQQLELLERSEIFEDSDKGFHFTATLVVYQRKGILYHAMLKSRYAPLSINTEDLINIKQIPASAYRPEFSVEFTLAPEILPDSYYVKKPRLISYDQISKGPRPDSIAEKISSRKQELANS